MKKSFLSRFALLFAVLTLAAFGTVTTHDAFAATKHTTHHAKKHSAKKYSSKKSKKKSVKTASAKDGFALKAPHAIAAPHARPIMGTPDPNVDEPTEMISAIKNRAQDQFWEGKRPYPQQLRDRANPPPPAPVLTGAIAQNELQKRGGEVNPVTGMRSDALRRVSYSDISGVTFADQPLRMNASEAFRRSLDTVSFELGRPCKSQEYFGWPMQQSEQSRVDRIFEETNAKFKLRGYNLQPRKPRSVGSDVSAFTADRGDKRVLGIWSAGDVGLLLLMCDSDAPPPSALSAKGKHGDAALTKKKTKKGKKKSRKTNAADVASSPSMTSGSTGATEPDAPTAPATDPNVGSGPAGAPAPADAKPQVIPGAPPKTLPPEPTQSVPQASPAAPAPLPTPAPATAPAPPAPTPAPKAETPGINPTNAFIPADAPTAMKAIAPDIKPPSVDGTFDAAKGAAVDAAKDAVKDVVKP